jgi:hypothetical protein
MSRTGSSPNPGRRRPPFRIDARDRRIRIDASTLKPDRSRRRRRPRAGLERDSLLADETLGIEPEFDSLRYGTPTYARLALTCPREISRGASDGGEMGVYHDLFQSQRVDAVTLALDDYTPAGMTVGLVFAT